MYCSSFVCGYDSNLLEVMENDQPKFDNDSLEGLQEKLDWYENKMKPVNNMGKWARQVAIDSTKEKIKKMQNKKL